ncbi:unnamed protein product [Bemisia tabaci]|uniref:PH domain-containing protein n=2 Tax=Bemisia tabaci TaxID=7038 RepID=A0A9P0A103_BEMTA|nr:unnamed protein product [Bemisia tabaci]
MEGSLLKWTNYWNGWQPRWFILENGILSYYMSLEEVNQGSKGAVKVSACEIIVSNVDNTRMDLVIPGEKHLYLKAASSQERQQWLIALGSSKACLTTRHRPGSDSSSPDSLKAKKSELKLYCDLLMQQIHTIRKAATGEAGPDTEKMYEECTLLEATCDTFIKTLEEIMNVSNSNSPNDFFPNSSSIFHSNHSGIKQQTKSPIQPSLPKKTRSTSHDR